MLKDLDHKMNPDNRNILDKYKNSRFTSWTEDLIKKDLKKTAFPFAVAMENWQGDFNLGTVIRSANAFNAEAVYYLGKKKFDKRGTVGTHLYTDVIHLPELKNLIELKNKYHIIGVENTVPNSIPIAEAKYDKPTIFVLGEEGIGITQETLDICDSFLHIPQYGSVRSLNAAVAGSIIMNDFVTKWGLYEKT